MTSQEIGGTIILAMGLLLHMLGIQRQHPIARAGGLLVVLTGFFVIFVSLVNRAYAQASLGVSLTTLGGAVALFRLLAGFEPSPTERGKKRESGSA